ncbi:FAD-dependent oxidoreductase [Candidatus Woesearchaeota archaeon]|nr:FAD-dependent oxidoreductase [Candidatus Woesearchaeota archaeon]
MTEKEVDIIILGGGVAGLWILNALTAEGYSVVLLEKQKLGQGQTICAQGIVHGGFKYVVPGKYRQGTASEVRNMPQRWREHCSGQRKNPDLSGLQINSPSCYFWLSKGRGLRGVFEEAFSTVGIGLLNSPPVDVTDSVPLWLKKSAAKIYAVPEQVIDSSALLQELAKFNLSQIYYFDSVSFIKERDRVRSVSVKEQKTGEEITFSAQAFLLTAGIGNQELVEAMGYPQTVMQIRPLRQLLVSGNGLPELWGHCIDGGKAVASVTTHKNPRTGEKVWNIGGEIAENGYKQDPEVLIREGRALLEKLLSGVDFSQTKWSTFDALRAEEPNDNLLPSGVSIRQIENIFVCFPTKMAMAPVLADQIVLLLEKEHIVKTEHIFERKGELHVAPYPWEDKF